MSALRTSFTRTMMRPMAARSVFRPALMKQLPRRNFTVGLVPGVEEQEIAHEAAT